jgi:ABC-type lipoprotein release transport system permease subunit
MLILGLATRNATRNVVRSLITASMIVGGTGLLTLVLCWINGVFGDLTQIGAASIDQVRLVDAEFAKREDLFPLYENIPEVSAVVAQVKGVPGVLGAYPRIVAGVTLTRGEEIGDVFGLAVGAEPAWYTEQLEMEDHIVDGRMLAGDEEILLGSTLATRTGAKVGDELVLLGQTQDGALSPLKGTIVGIVHGGNIVFDQQVFLTLPKMQYMADVPGGATEILVYGADRDDADELADAIRPVAGDLLVESWRAREPWAGILGIVGVVRNILTGGVVFVVALGVWNTMMMSVLERTGEIGVLRAMGLGRAGAVVLFVVEAATIAVLGGLLGVGIGAIGGWMLETWGISLGSGIVQNLEVPVSTRMYGDLDLQVCVSAFLLGLLMAVVGSAPPALRAASIQPVTAMRARR